MLAVSSSRTMANARPKFREPEQSVLTILPREGKVIRFRSPEQEAEIEAEHQARMRRIEKMEAAVREKIEAERRKSLERAREVLRELELDNLRYRHTVREIERRACKLFGVSINEIRGIRRHRHICIARQFIYYWSYRLTERSLPEIGRLLGSRDHSTVLHGVKTYHARRAKAGRVLRPAR